jgi:hypothetical protein
MKNVNLVVVCAALAIALALPTEAFAKKMAIGQTHSSADYIKILKICREKYGNGYDVTASWESHYGKTGWFCRSRIN